MKMQSEIVVTGFKASKGDYEGTAYDNTKVFALVDMDGKGGNSIGQASAVFTFGTSETFEQYKHLKASLPARALAEFEMVTNGRDIKQVLVGLKFVDKKVG